MVKFTKSLRVKIEIYREVQNPIKYALSVGEVSHSRVRKLKIFCLPVAKEKNICYNVIVEVWLIF